MSLNKLDKMPLLDANVVKIAVEMEFENPQFKEFNQKIPLNNIVQDLCSNWDLIDPEQYALKFSEKTNQNYVTEENRNKIKNGCVLRLAFSPSKIAQDILQTLHLKDCMYYGKIWFLIKSLICCLFLRNMQISKVLSTGNDDRNERTSALQKLSKYSTDITFAVEFIKIKGLALIISFIESGKCQGPMLTYALASFVKLMDHGIVSWEILETPFINMIASYVNNQTPRPQEAKVLKSSLFILKSIVLNSSAKYGQVEKEVELPNLLLHLENKNPIIQQNALSLINALFLKADPSKRKMIGSTLCNEQVRNVILQNIIQTSSGEVGSEMAHQLYVMQTLCFGLLEERMKTKINLIEDDELVEKLFGTNSSMDNIPFSYIVTPPGILTVDCMEYFAHNHEDFYRDVFVANSLRSDENQLPFFQSSEELVRMLYIFFKIGELPNEQTHKYYQIFFTHDHPFHELYCICFVFLNNLWTQMGATVQVLTMIVDIVRIYIIKALNSQTPNFITLGEEINSLRREECKLYHMLRFKHAITPAKIEIIKKQRLGYMVDGTRFTKYSQHGQRVKHKFWFVRLSQNHEVLHYGDCDDKSVPTIEQLPNKLRIVDIKELLTGKDCPHIKNAKNRKSTHKLAFSLTLDSVKMTQLYFVAPDQMVYDYWIDGINALLGNKMTSKEANCDLDILLSIELHVDFPPQL